MLINKCVFFSLSTDAFFYFVLFDHYYFSFFYCFFLIFFQYIIFLLFNFFFFSFSRRGLYFSWMGCRFLNFDQVREKGLSKTRKCLLITCFTCVQEQETRNKRQLVIFFWSIVHTVSVCAVV